MELYAEVEALRADRQLGATSTATNDSRYNVTLGARRYLIQQNWVNGPRGNTNGYCSMAYP